ncbi:MAG: Ig-like domain-containing protein [Clostridia bacterium]|nr:Ig-like domain-containing protein [Clostridia bacterium]
MKSHVRIICLLAVLLCLVQPALPFACAADGDMIRSGDVDGDGAVTAADARAALRISASLFLCAEEVIPYADSDGDGKVLAEDARIILRYSAKLEPEESLNLITPPVQKALQTDGIPYYNKQQFNDLTLTEGENALLGENVFLRSDSNCKWTSSNPDAVSVSSTGNINAKKKGFSCVYLTVGDKRYYWFVNVITELQKKIYDLQEKYPDGYYWNKHTKSKQYPFVSEIPCDDHESGKYEYCQGQCVGFARQMSIEVFGTQAPVTYYSDPQMIKIGDYLRMLPNHSVFVIDRTEKDEITGYDIFSDTNHTAGMAFITVCECNWDWHCGISWGRRIPFDSIRLDSDFSATRY